MNTGDIKNGYVLVPGIGGLIPCRLNAVSVENAAVTWGRFIK
jgi:hypothetical protein